jgi:hypothetical protein
MTPDRSEGNHARVPLGTSGESVSKGEGELAAPDALNSSGFELFNSVDSMIWQRMAEDRLSDEQYRELLLAMEATPSLWRDCALAFLEEQALKKSFVGLRSGWKVTASANSEVRDSGLAQNVGQAAMGTRAGDVVDRASAQSTAMPVVSAQVDAAYAAPRRGNGPWRVTMPLLAAAAGFAITIYAFQGHWQAPSVEPEANSTPIVMDRESFRDYLAELSVDQRRELFERSEEQAMGMPIQAQPVSMSPDRAGGQRRFLFYRTPSGRQIIVPVDDYQFATHDFQ